MSEWDKALAERIKQLSEKIDDLVALRDSYILASGKGGAKPYSRDEVPVREWDDKAGY